MGWMGTGRLKSGFQTACLLCSHISKLFFQREGDLFFVAREGVDVASDFEVGEFQLGGDAAGQPFFFPHRSVGVGFAVAAGDAAVEGGGVGEFAGDVAAADADVGAVGEAVERAEVGEAAGGGFFLVVGFFALDAEAAEGEPVWGEGVDGGGGEAVERGVVAGVAFVAVFFADEGVHAGELQAGGCPAGKRGVCAGVAAMRRKRAG